MFREQLFPTGKPISIPYDQLMQHLQVVISQIRQKDSCLQVQVFYLRVGADLIRMKIVDCIPGSKSMLKSGDGVPVASYPGRYAGTRR